MAVTIEDIEEMRLDLGIDDIELREEIRSLRAGDHVKLTLLTGTASFEMLTVRITRIRGEEYQGKLIQKPKSNSLADLEVGSALLFGARHIHSIERREAAPKGGI